MISPHVKHVRTGDKNPQQFSLTVTQQQNVDVLVIIAQSRQGGGGDYWVAKLKVPRRIEAVQIRRMRSKWEQME